jgi:hypothetical protein
VCFPQATTVLWKHKRISLTSLTALTRKDRCGVIAMTAIAKRMAELEKLIRAASEAA